MREHNYADLLEDIMMYLALFLNEKTTIRFSCVSRRYYQIYSGINVKYRCRCLIRKGE